MNSPILTDNGRELLNRTLANKGIIKFSKMTISDNQIPKLSASIVGYNYNKENVYVVSSFTNENLATSFIVKILNIYAIDTNTGTEILYATSTNTTGDTFNSKDLGFQKKIYELYVGFSNSSQITIEINPSIGSEYTDNVREQIGIETGTFINLQNGFNGGLLLKELQGKSTQNGTPTPEVPVDIVSVGDDGSVVVKTTGKNLLPKATPKTLTNGGITTTVNEDGTFTSNWTYTGSSSGDVNNWIAGNYAIVPSSSNTIVTLYPNETYTIKDVVLFTVEKGNPRQMRAGTVTISAEQYPNGFRVTGVRHDYVSEGATLTNKVYYPQLELGSTSTTYEPYKEQLVTIPLTQPLRSVGSVHDRIIKKDGVWGIERNIAIAVLRKIGVSDIIEGTDSNFWRVGQNFVNGILSKTSSSHNYLLCDRITITKQIEEYWYPVFNMSTYSHKDKFELRINAPKSLYPTKESLVTFLNSITWNFIYALETPTFEPFAQSIQDQLNKLQTYQGVTNVFTTDALQPTLSVSYGKTDASSLSIYANNIYDSKLDKSKGANNGLTTEEGFYLDARYGKTLKEGLDTVNNNLTAKSVEIITGVSCKYNAYQVQLYLDGAISDSSGLICTLPVTCRPLRNVKIPVTVHHDITNNAYNVSAFVLVQIDGKCVLYTAGISKIQAEYINGTHMFML